MAVTSFQCCGFVLAARAAGCLAVALAAFSCSSRPPDGVYWCAADSDCPSGQTCFNELCGSALLRARWADGSTAPGLAGEQQRSGLRDGAAGEHSGPDGGVALQPVRDAAALGDGAPETAGNPATQSGGAGAGDGAQARAGNGGAQPPAPDAGTQAQPGKCPMGACAPGGSCVEDQDDYSCSCKPGYTGTGTKACMNINDCPKDACAPGGRCADGFGDYTCLCALKEPAPPTKLSCPYVPGPDGVVTDSTTGLTWARADTFQQEQRERSETGTDYCAALDDAGGGWRLPTPAELQSKPEVSGGCYFTTGGEVCIDVMRETICCTLASCVR